MSNLPYFSRVAESESDWFESLIGLARFLRGPDGCPWDRERTAIDFARYCGEEVQELLEALNGGDGAHTEEEFGDVFFTLLASAAAAEEAGGFQLKRALERCHEKMVRRHDHVFGDTKATTPEQAIQAWDEAKKREKESK